MIYAVTIQDCDRKPRRHRTQVWLCESATEAQEFCDSWNDDPRHMQPGSMTIAKWDESRWLDLKERP